MLEDQTPDEEATRQVIAAFQYLDDDEEHVLWIASAAAQSSVGRLSEHVKRQAALAKLRDQLLGPRPERKTIRRP